MDDIAFARYVGGFGLVRNVSAAEYRAARPDPVAAFSATVCGHMNADHVADTLAMLQHYVGIQVGGCRRGAAAGVGAGAARAVYGGRGGACRRRRRESGPWGPQAQRWRPLEKRLGQQQPGPAEQPGRWTLPPSCSPPPPPAASPIPALSAPPAPPPLPPRRPRRLPARACWTWTGWASTWR
jgi:hypothetical protein